MGGKISSVLVDPNPARAREKHQRLKRSGVLNDIDIANVFDGYDWDLFSPGLTFVGPLAPDQVPDEELIARIQEAIRLIFSANKIGQEIVSRRVAMVEADGKLQDEELDDEDEYESFKKEIEPDIKAARGQYMAAKKDLTEQLRREDISTEEADQYYATHSKWKNEFEGLTKDLEDAAKQLAATKERMREARASLREEYDAFVQRAEESERKFKEEGGVSLRFAECGIVRLPETFGYLTNLQQLELQGNGLLYIPSSFGNLTELNYLDLSENKLRDIPDSFGNLTKLRDLYLQNNRLYSVPASIGRLAILECFHINGNPLSDNALDAPRGVNTNGLEIRDYFADVYHNEVEAEEFESKLLEVGAMRALLPAANFRETASSTEKISMPALDAADGHRLTEGKVQHMTYRERQNYYREQKELDEAAEAEAEAKAKLLADELASDPDPELLRNFYANQHRLESITRDGAALLNPRLLWCGWTKRLVRMGEIRGYRSLNDAVSHWRGNNAASAQSAKLPYKETGGPLRAAEMVVETMDRQDPLNSGERLPPGREYDFPNSRLHCDSIFEDDRAHAKLVDENTRLECDMADYMPSVMALRNGNLAKAVKRMFKTNPPKIEDLIMHQKIENVRNYCTTCQEFDGPYPAWRNGDAILGHGEWRTSEDSAAEEVHARLHRVLSLM